MTTCAACGRTFEAKSVRAKYCSPRCRWRLVKSGGMPYKPIERQCVVCETVFLSRSRSAKREKFCSPRCRVKHWNAIMAKRPRPRWNRAPRRCEHCGAEYMPTTPRARWCQRSCRMKGSYAIHKARRRAERQLPKTCVECGQDFTPNAFVGQRQTYCSRRCSLRVASRTIRARRPEGQKGRTIPRDIRRRIAPRIVPPPVGRRLAGRVLRISTSKSRARDPRLRSTAAVTVSVRLALPYARPGDWMRPAHLVSLSLLS